MSAWICSRTHIAAVAKAAVQLGVIQAAQAVENANALEVENFKSVDYRYREHNIREGEVTQADIDHAPILSLHGTLKAVHCLNYQSCEHPGWMNSNAEHLLAAIEAIAKTRGAVEGSPAYESEPWGIE